MVSAPVSVAAIVVSSFVVSPMFFLLSLFLHLLGGLLSFFLILVLLSPFVIALHVGARLIFTGCLLLPVSLLLLLWMLLSLLLVSLLLFSVVASLVVAADPVAPLIVSLLVVSPLVVAPLVVAPLIVAIFNFD